MCTYLQALARITAARFALANVRKQDRATISLLRSTSLISFLLHAEASGEGLNTDEWASILTKLSDVDFLEDDRSAIFAIARRSAKKLPMMGMMQKMMGNRSASDEDLGCDLQIFAQQAANFA